MNFIKTLAIFTLSLLIVNGAVACEPMQSEDFSLNRDVDLVSSHFEKTQVPKLEFVGGVIYRGSNGDGWSCKDIGSAWLVFSLPDDSNLNFEDFGISLRVKKVLSSENVIGPIDRIISPVIVEGNKAKYLITWNDGHDKWPEEINIILEARIVLKNGKAGAPIEFGLNGQQNL